MAIRGQYKEVATSDLEPNEYNPNVQSTFMFEKQQESLRQMDFLDPVLVRSGNEHGAFEKLRIIDGEHRWRAATKLAQAEISVIDLGVVPDEEAKKLTILMNELRGSPEKTKLASLINELVEFSADTDRLKALMPYTETEFRAFAEMASFDWSSLDGDAPAGDRDGEGTGGQDTEWLDLAFRLADADAELVKRALADAGGKDESAQLVALARAYLASKEGTKRKKGS